MTACPDPSRLLDLVYGELEPDAADGLRAHAAACAECGAALDGLLQEAAVLGDALAGDPAAPAGLEERVLAAVAGAPGPAGRSPLRLIALAASLLVATGLWWVAQQQERPVEQLVRRARVSELKALGLEVER